MQTSNFLAAFVFRSRIVAFSIRPPKESRKWSAAFNCESVNTHKRSSRIITSLEPITKQSVIR